MRDAQGNIVYFWSVQAEALTNNEAEYEAVIMALERLSQSTYRRKRRKLRLRIYTDSQVLVRQMQGRALTNAPGLKTAQARLRRLVLEFGEVTFQHVPREQNRLADALANEAVEGKAFLVFK